MTESKMTSILVDLLKKGDYGVFYLIDSWQTDSSKRVREIIKLSDILEEFKKKEGRFYNKYKFKSDFKELVKHLDKGEEMEIKCFYRDTYEDYMKKWKERHPNEKDYGTWLKNMQRTNMRKYKQYISSMGFFGFNPHYKTYLF